MLAVDPAKNIPGYAPALRDQFSKLGDPALYAKNVANWMNQMAEDPSAEGQYAAARLAYPLFFIGQIRRLRYSSSIKGK
jgi:hypothetical protein